MKSISFVVWKENDQFVAQCLNVDVSSYGKTLDEATKNLKEAVELYFQGEPDFILPVVDSIFVGPSVPRLRLQLRRVLGVNLFATLLLKLLLRMLRQFINITPHPSYFLFSRPIFDLYFKRLCLLSCFTYSSIQELHG